MVYSRNLKVVAISALALSMFGCGKKKSKSSSDDGSSDLTISGQLSLSGSDNSGAALTGFDSNLNLGSFNVTADDLSIYCVTFTLPPVAGTGEVSADGAFSLNIANGKDASVGCFILKGTTQLGTIVFEDPSEKSLSGENSTADKTAFSGNANLGAITFDLETGKAVVDLSKVVVTKKVDASAETAFDFTGTYKITASGITQPTGYTAPCPARVPGQQGDNCNGPKEGENVYFRRLVGKSTEDAGKDVFGVMVWASKASHVACGEKLGMTYADARANAKVELKDSGVPEGIYEWTTGYADGWKKTNAVSQFARPVSRPLTVNGIAGVIESVNNQNGTQDGRPKYDGTYVGFDFRPTGNKEMGCKDAAGNPAQPTKEQWLTMLRQNDGGEIAPNTYIYKSTSKTADGTITCVHIGGRFTGKATFETETDGIFAPLQWSETAGRKEAAKGIACATVASNNALEGLRCYADALHSNGDNGGNGEENACIREVNFNWGAKTPEDFVGQNKGPVKARNQYLFEKFRYDSANSGSFRFEEERFDGVNTGNDWIDCRTFQRMNFSIKAISGSKDLFVEMVQERRNADPKPACIAALKDEGGVSKSLFNMVLQPQTRF